MSESGWLIEFVEGGASPSWLMLVVDASGNTDMAYTHHAADALRFARKVDAELFMRYVSKVAPWHVATEHLWED